MNPYSSPESSSTVAETSRKHEFHHLRARWCWLLALGILLVACGTLAIIFPIVSTWAVVDVLSVILLIAGGATIVASFWAGRWSGGLVQLLFGVLYIVAGLVVTERPLMSALVITILIAVSFIVAGAFRTLAALIVRFPLWGWSVLNGLVTMLVGIVIFRHLPLSVFWVIGLLVGIELLFSGWTWIMLSLAVRNLPEEAA